MLNWECDDCGHKEIEECIYTFVHCPNCKSENFFHEDLIVEETK